jgi:hypothetical protein
MSAQVAVVHSRQAVDFLAAVANPAIRTNNREAKMNLMAYEKLSEVVDGVRKTQI